jgi:hypothetical protein
MPRRLRHTIRHTERIYGGCWEVRTQTEDGRRFTAVGVTRQQAIYRTHHKARAYGRYAYPTAAARERREAVAHMTLTFVQDGSCASHQSCAASVALRGYPETGLGKRCVLIDSWRIPYPQGVRRHATGRTAPQDVSLGFDG